ncbi:MAG: PepSY domain-containing protein [Gammaproteobacteria bacterium]|nr:PepSY domain-containing protein [Gammaproteobacteria bacterium]
MLRRILFQCHWFVGITLGALLAFSGLTGGLMAFGPQLTDFFSGGYQPVGRHGAAPLGAGELYARVQAALPGRKITELTTYADPGRPARVRLAVAASRIGPTAPIAETRMVDPYSGVLLPARPLGPAMERCVHWLREVHQGHWGGPASPVARSGGLLVGLGSVLLLLLVLSGLYLRWPAGRSVRSWRAWLAIYPRLKGRAFLFNLHAVVGTVALLFLLVSAHSGAFQSGPMGWYGNGVRALFGLPHGATQSTLDIRSGVITPQLLAAAARTVGERLLATNQILHEGRLFGPAGTRCTAVVQGIWIPRDTAGICPTGHAGPAASL